jgi:ABC-type oligopeptide transport system substrate-binding subunit
MRDIIKKTTAVAMVAAAALSLAACKSETTNTTENVSMTDMNAEGSMNDMAATDMNSSNASDSMMGDNTSNME